MEVGEYTFRPIIKMIDLKIWAVLSILVLKNFLEQVRGC